MLRLWVKKDDERDEKQNKKIDKKHQFMKTNNEQFLLHLNIRDSNWIVSATAAITHYLYFFINSLAIIYDVSNKQKKKMNRCKTKNFSLMYDRTEEFEDKTTN